ncbi:MAG: SDR family NAD(P)-dependent oxidoreductase, partial [Chlorobi bacterium]|nr:SDR family NAD(P)-dependent oxidoreductase [Chlorobiota bacterium]
MLSLKGKTVFITGASSGIGLASAKAFAKKGANLILAARRFENIKNIGSKLSKQYKIECKTFKLDVRKKNDVESVVKNLPAKWKNIDILVNNAGLSRGLDKLHEGKIPDWDEMIDTNVKGLLYISKTVIPLMVKRNSGHIINIGSIAGHEVYPKGNVYCA